MVLSFFMRRESGMDLITGRVVQMLSDVRHSFDLATAAVLHGAVSPAVATEIKRTDLGINEAEQELRRELIVHITVHGTENISDVLSHILLIKRIERLGDQAKNIFEMAEDGFSFVDAPDVESFQEVHTTISAMLGEVVELILDPDHDRIAEFSTRAKALEEQQAVEMRELMHCDEPGHYAVPRAILHRYLKRVIANIDGVITTLIEPVQPPGA